jgi:hypothetical protein
MDVHVLQHVHPLGNDEKNVKMISVYSSQEAAEAAVERLREQPGLATLLTASLSTATLLTKTTYTTVVRGAS